MKYNRTRPTQVVIGGRARAINRLSSFNAKAILRLRAANPYRRKLKGTYMKKRVYRRFNKKRTYRRRY